MGKILALIASFGLLCTAGLPACADNLVQNPGFESIDSSSGFALPAAWTLTNAAVGSNFWVSAWDSHSGLNAMQFAGTSYDSISQTLSTTAGQKYSLSFWLDIDSLGLAENSFQAYWDGTLVSDVKSSTASAGHYAEYSATVIGTGGDVLKLQGYNTASVDHLDDVSVSTASSPVPEPASLLLSGLAVLGLPFYRKLRSRS